MPKPSMAPSARIGEVAKRSAAAFEFFLEKFGDPAQAQVVVSPAPGETGQGFPGLVYVSTKSYFRPGDRPLEGMSPELVRYYTDVLIPHEPAHQWWGAVVTVEQPADAWIMEGLATYSALLFVEHEQGRSELEEILRSYRDRLLRVGENGATLEGAGPIVLGDRLTSSKSPDAFRTIAYEKGAWIFHRLRDIMGNHNFFSFLKGLRDQFAFRPITTEQLREQAVRWLPEPYPDSDLREFFAAWAYTAGTPDWDPRTMSPERK